PAIVPSSTVCAAVGAAINSNASNSWADFASHTVTALSWRMVEALDFPKHLRGRSRTRFPQRAWVGIILPSNAIAVRFQSGACFLSYTMFRLAGRNSDAGKEAIDADNCGVWRALSSMG